MMPPPMMTMFRLSEAAMVADVEPRWVKERLYGLILESALEASVMFV